MQWHSSWLFGHWLSGEKLKYIVFFFFFSFFPFYFNVNTLSTMFQIKDRLHLCMIHPVKGAELVSGLRLDCYCRQTAWWSVHKAEERASRALMCDSRYQRAAAASADTNSHHTSWHPANLGLVQGSSGSVEARGDVWAHHLNACVCLCWKANRYAACIHTICLGCLRRWSRAARSQCVQAASR